MKPIHSLFIDEAYTLARGENDFGQEAIDTILKAMEDLREDFVVIVAGYTELMKEFIGSNPGLKSRFNKYIEFPDYTADELVKIFYTMTEKYNFRLTDKAKEKAEEKRGKDSKDGGRKRAPFCERAGCPESVREDCDEPGDEAGRTSGRGHQGDYGSRYLPCLN